MKSFTQPELETIRQEWAAGKSAAQIGNKLGRTKGSILGKIDRLGLTRQPQPDKPRDYPQERRRPFNALPIFEAGCKMPTAASITAADGVRRKSAEIGSRQLRDAMLLYGAQNGGVLNLTADECRRRLAQ